MPFWKSVVPHDREIRRGDRKFMIGERSFNGYENDRVWRNNGDGTFTEIGWVAGGDLILDSRACATADFDRDGRVDLAVRTMYEKASLFHNEGDGGRFLHVRLVGTRSNRMGVGARVEAEAGGRRYAAEMTCGSGYLSQNEPAVRLGLGRHDRVDRLRVRWPSGETQEFRDVPTGRFLTITEGSPEVRTEAPRSAWARKAEAPVPDPAVAALKRGKYVDLKGEPVSAEAFLKEPTLVHVWSLACKGCEKEAATLESLSKHAPVVAIAVDSKPEDVRAFLERRRATYPVIVADAEAGRALAAVPRGPRGVVRRQFGGWFELGNGEEQALPWSGVVDRNGLQRLYRGPVKRFEALMDLLAAREEGLR